MFKKEKNLAKGRFRIPKRVLALVLAIALIIPASYAMASDQEEEPIVVDETQVLSELSGDDFAWEEDLTNEAVASEAVSSDPVNAELSETKTTDTTADEGELLAVEAEEDPETPDRSTVTLGESGTSNAVGSVTLAGDTLRTSLHWEEDNYDIRKGITATDSTGADVSELVAITNNGGYVSTVPGTYEVTYAVLAGEKVLGQLTRTVVVHPYFVQAPDLSLSLTDGVMEGKEGEEDTVLEVDLTENITIWKEESVLVENPDIKVLDADGFVDSTSVDHYTIRYAFAKDGEELFEFERAVAVTVPRMSRATGIMQSIPEADSTLSIEGASNGTYRVADSNFPRQPYQFYNGDYGGGTQTNGWDIGTGLLVDGQKYLNGYLGIGINVGPEREGTLKNAVVTKPDNRTICWTWTIPHSKQGKYTGDIIFSQFINLPENSRQAALSWTIRNNTNQPLSNVQLVHGGDTYFAGDDFGIPTWRSETRTISIKRKDYPEGAGRFTFKSDASTPSSAFDARNYGVGRSNAIAFNLGNKVLPVPEDGNSRAYDASAYHQWKNITIPVSGSKEIKASMAWSLPGSVKITGPAPTVSPDFVVITHIFELENETDEDVQIINLYAQSDQGWSAVVNHDPEFTVPAHTTLSIPVILTVPKGAADGTKDHLQLHALDRYGNAYVGDTFTTIDVMMEAIQEIRIVKQTNTQLTVAVDFRNIPDGMALLTEAKLLGPDGEALSDFYKQNKVIQSGGEFVFDISGLAKPSVYFVKSEAERIKYPAQVSFYMESTISSIALTPKYVELTVGDVFLDFNAELFPPDADNKRLIWISDKSSVADIDEETGGLEAMSPGTAVITVHSRKNPEIFDTAIVKVVPQVSDFTTSPTTVLLRKNQTETVTTVVDPITASDQKMNWGPSNAMATVTPSADKKSAVVKGVSDGSFDLKITSNANVAISKTVKVNVDTIAPKFEAFTQTETANPWNRLATKQEIEVNITVSDNKVNNFASGVDKIYYVVASGTTAPAFNESNPTANGWKATTGNPAKLTLNKGTVGGDGTYTVFAVAVDKAGNFSSVTAAGESLDVDTTVPEIILPGGTDGNGSNIHVVVGTVSIDYKTGVVVKDNGVDVSDQVVIDSSNVKLNVPGAYIVKYSYKDKAGNSTTVDRKVFVHGKPGVTTGNPVNVSITDGILSLLNVPDARIGLVVENPHTYDVNGNRTTIVPNATVTGANITVDKLDLVAAAGTATLPTEVRVTYKVSYKNPVLGDITVDSSHTTTIKIWANGTLPGGPDPEIEEPGGIITPPITPIEPGTDPEEGGVNPLDPTGITRIMYYQKNGVVRADGTTQPGLTADEVIKAVNATNATSKKVTIRLGGIGSPAVDLTADTLKTALETVGQKKIVYTFANDKGSTSFTVMLLVNSDMVASAPTPIDTTVGGAVNLATGKPTAKYTNYGNREIALTVTNPAAPTLTTVGAQTLKYTAQYPFADKPIDRVLRVHGVPVITAKSPVNVNENEGSIQLLETADGRIELVVAPVKYVAADGTIQTATPTVSVAGTGVTANKLDYTSILGALNPRDATVTYTATYNNPLLNVALTTTKQNIIVAIYKNGTLPGGPDPEIEEPGGIITPPVKPGPDPGTDPEEGGNINPLDPTGITRIMYYQKNGVVRADGTTQPGLTADEVIKAVNATNATSKKVTIRLGGIGTPAVDLTADTLKTAVETVGYKKIVYTFANDKGSTSFTVMLLVNSDMVASAPTPIDTTVGGAVDLATGKPTAKYTNYGNREITLTVTNPAAPTLTTVGAQTLKYTAQYPFADKPIDRVLRVHGVPVITAKSPVNVNENEGSIQLLETADGRIELVVAPVKYVAADGTVKTATPTVSVAGTGVTANKLNYTSIIGALNPREATVTYTATYNNPLLNATLTTTKQNIIVAIYKNGTLPGGPDPEIEEPGGIITPPITPIEPGTDPEEGGGVNPLDPTGITRIMYYQKNGVVRADGSTQPGLTADEVINAVKATNATSKKVTIRLGAIGSPVADLTESTLKTALETVGQKKIVYTFANDKGSTSFTVMLRVNSDMVASASTPIDTTVGGAANLATGKPTAKYTNYGNREIALTVVNPAAPTLTTVGAQTLKYTAKYPFADKPINRVLRVHGVPVITAKSPVNVNENEGSIQLLETADGRIELVVAPVKYVTADGTIQTVTPTVSVAGTGVTANKLDYASILGALNPRDATVTYTATYNNPLLNVALTTTKQNIIVAIYKNGTLPGGPDPEITDPGGVITPPTDPIDPGTDPEEGGGVNPLDPTGVTRIMYYQKNGVVRANGTTQPGLTASEVINAVKATNATSKKVTIRLGGIGSPAVDLTADTLKTALETVGQKKIVYTFANDKGSTSFTVMLRVNSDMVASASAPVDSIQNITIDWSVGKPTATYDRYDAQTVTLNPTDPTGFSSAAVKAENVKYAVTDYPFPNKTITRLVRIHGKVALTVAGDMNGHIRTNNINGDLMNGVNAAVTYAPLTAGGTAITTVITNQVALTGNLSGLATPSKEKITYRVSFALPAAYNTSLILPQATPVERTITSHDDVILNANDITVGIGFTKDQFDPLTDPDINLSASVHYYSTGIESLSGKITVDPAQLNAIKFGIPNVYPLTYTVSDTNAVNRPSGLIPATKSVTIYVTVSDGNVGVAPSIDGAQNKNILVGTSLSKADLLSGVTAKDNKKDQPIAPSEIKISVSNGSNNIAIDAIGNAVGSYTVTYTVKDSRGDSTSVNSMVYVYGRMEVKADNAIQNYRQGFKENNFSPNYSNIYGQYESPLTGMVVVKQADNASLYSINSGGINLDIHGNQTAPVTVIHPLFSTNSATGNITVKVHGPIVFTASTQIRGCNSTIPSDGTIIDTMTGATATYTNADGATVTLPNLVCNFMPTAQSNGVDKIIFNYSVADDIVVGLTESFRFELSGISKPPTLSFSSTVGTVRLIRKPTAATIGNYFTIQQATFARENGTVLNLRSQVIYDTSGVNFAAKGSYPVTASLTYNGMTTTVNLTFTIT